MKRILLVSVYALAIITGLVCVAFALGETLLLGSFSGSYLFVFPLVPLVANMVYLVWVTISIAIGATRNEVYRTRRWLPILLVTFVVILYNYLL